MAVPDFQSIMLPLLRLAADDEEHLGSEAISALAEQLGLGEDEQAELLPSGRQTKFANRVAWARTHLKHGGLLESTARGRFRITERGLNIVTTNPSAINMKFLEQFPEYLHFRSLRATSAANGGQDSELTPEEMLESSHLRLRQALAEELLQRVRASSPRFFEQLVVDLLVAMGYGGSRKDAGQAVGQSGDGGIDGIIKEDKLGLDVVYVQAKRWTGIVGRSIVQAFAGSLEGHRARKGVLITTSNFTRDSLDYVTRIEKRIVLIDGQQLADLMIDHGVGVGEVATYSLKRVDVDYFEGEPEDPGLAERH